MGGGAAMRTAGKIAGVGVINSGFRSAVYGLPPAEQSVRKASRPVSAVISSSSSPSDAGAVQRPVSEFEEWEFAGGEEEELMLLESAGPKPRLVFGPPPSPKEAKEATTELKDALGRLTLENPAHESSVASVGFGVLTTSDLLGTKSCLTSERKEGPVPENAIRAFKLLNESPAAQSVVASIAADPNVWHAVMNNDALAEFLLLHKTMASTVSEEATESDADSNSVDVGSPELCEDECRNHKSKAGFMDFLDDIRVSMVDMFGTVSSFLQNMFGVSFGAADDDESKAGDGNVKSTFLENSLGATFMALAVMAIMTVVLKRY